MSTENTIKDEAQKLANKDTLMLRGIMNSFFINELFGTIEHYRDVIMKDNGKEDYYKGSIIPLSFEEIKMKSTQPELFPDEKNLETFSSLYEAIKEKFESEKVINLAVMGPNCKFVIYSEEAYVYGIDFDSLPPIEEEPSIVCMYGSKMITYVEGVMLYLYLSCWDESRKAAVLSQDEIAEFCHEYNTHLERIIQIAISNTYYRLCTEDTPMNIYMREHDIMHYSWSTNYSNSDGLIFTFVDDDAQENDTQSIESFMDAINAAFPNANSKESDDEDCDDTELSLDDIDEMIRNSSFSDDECCNTEGGCINASNEEASCCKETCACNKEILSSDESCN